MPLYDISNTKRIIGNIDGFEFPRLDKTLLQKYLNYWGIKLR